MYATGIVRPVDKLGRVVLPKELLRKLNIGAHEELEFFVEDGGCIKLAKPESLSKNTKPVSKRKRRVYGGQKYVAGIY